MKKQLFLFSLLLFTSIPTVLGTHIIGGDFSYNCTSPGNYTFTLTMYRDCQSSGAAFDSAPGAFTVGTVTVFNGSADPWSIIELDPPIIDELDPEAANPCAETPPNVCVQKGTYTFSANLPVSMDSYYVVYQRCCRNPTITNIVDPDAQGMTFVLEINAESQQVCNSSPAFVDFPPPVICVGEALNFDHSAFDPDGDQLIYSFCNPLDGGSQMNPAPNPDNAPPYENVDFVIPFYSPTNPIGGSPQVSINNSTGKITGVPMVEGQFVVGVCISEFRNGVLLSQTQRDFQFNVTTCNPIINANLDLEVNAGLNVETIDLCGVLDVDIINQSQIEANIDEYFWEIEVPGGNYIFDTRNVNFTLPDFGYYPGKMILNPGSQCKDSLEFIIRAAPPISAEISAVYDTCEVGPVQYLDISPLTSADFPIVAYNWNLGDGITSSEKFPLIEYETPGIKNVSLLFRDTLGCEASTQKSIVWQPAPEIVIVDPSEDEICPETTVFFINESFPIDDTYELNWNFGDGGTAVGISVENLFQEPGNFTLAIEIISPIGCYATDTFTNLIFVDSFPVADFNVIYPDDFNIDNPTIELIEDSYKAVGWDWMLPDGLPQYGQEASYTFQDTGYHEVGLIVQHAFGCYDTIYQQIDVAPANNLLLPNAFSPNGNGLNDLWRPNGKRLEQFESYDLAIFDRWGSLIYSAKSPFMGWSGDFKGQPALEGTYSYILSYKLPRQSVVNTEGLIMLIR